MEGEEFKIFTEDIRANGVREPITIFEDKILEGRNRYRAGRYKLNEGNFRPYTGTDPLGFVISANVHRRHLDTSQRAMTAARLVTSKLGDNQHKNGLTTGQAAKMLNVSEASVKNAKLVIEKAAPEVLKKVEEGKARIGTVLALVDKPKDQQVQELKRIEDARKAAAKSPGRRANKQPEANQAMINLDAFKTKWQGFDKMQRKAFVTWFKAKLAELLELIKQEAAMIGGTGS